MATNINNYKGLEVIGAGYGRTGTVSLQKAFEILGYGPCYHMIDIYTNGHKEFWMKVFEGEKMNYKEIYDNKQYKSCCDNPMSSFWKEQAEQYPDAKVILTVRDPEKWYKSWNDTINTITSGSPHSSFLLNVVEYVLGIRTFHMALKLAMFGESWAKDHFIACYRAHNDRVIAECPKDRLLVYEVSQGWDPLCKFLNKPIPNVPFPHLNDTKELQRSRLIIEIVGGVIVAVAIAVPVLGAVYLANNGHFHGRWSSFKSWFV